MTTEYHPETKQMTIAGAGDIHLDVICSKLKNKFGVEVELSAPIVPYREKIRKKVSVEGKHKKQSGGHGQYGHVKMDFEPYEGRLSVCRERFLAARFRKTSGRQWKRESMKPWSMVYWLDIRWLDSRQR